MNSMNQKGNVMALIFIAVALFIIFWAYQVITSVMSHVSTMPSSGSATMFNNAVFGFIAMGFIALIGVIVLVAILGLLARVLLGKNNQFSKATQKPIAKVIGRTHAKTIYGNSKGSGF